MTNLEYLTVPEMAAYLGVSKKTAYKLLTKRRIPSYRYSERKTIVKKADIDAFIENSRRT